eukprot:4453387-Prymnesium_polylepis.1
MTVPFELSACASRRVARPPTRWGLESRWIHVSQVKCKIVNPTFSRKSNTYYFFRHRAPDRTGRDRESRRCRVRPLMSCTALQGSGAVEQGRARVLTCMGRVDGLWLGNYT